MQGFVDYFKKSHAWGEMTRQCFNQGNQDLPFKDRMWATLQVGLQKWGVFASVFFLLFSVGIAVEWAWYRYTFPAINSSIIGENLLLNNFIFILKLIFGFGIIYLLINFVKENWAKALLMVAFTIIVVSQYLLFIYFSESRNLLGADILYYSEEEMKQILEASGMLNFQNTALIIILIAISFVPFWLAAKSSFKAKYIGLTFLGLGVISFLIPTQLVQLNNSNSISEFDQNAAKSKWAYFFNSNVDNFVNDYPELASLWGETNSFEMSSEMIDKEFPFWRKENTADFLGSYLTKSEKVPNLVFVIVEGLGHAYSSPNGYVGNFTPFIDSLAHKSLYWENNLSSSGRTFGVLPTITGSLPFGKNGFLEIEKTPDHFNLYNVLKSNGFATGFFYGGNSSFDRTKEFLQYSKVDHIIDQFSYEAPYQKLPA